MVGFSAEFRRARQVIEYVFERETSGGRACPPAVGCMIEVPRIALNAADLAAHADFLSIGSNDPTEFTGHGSDRHPIIALEPTQT